MCKINTKQYEQNAKRFQLNQQSEYKGALIQLKIMNN